MNIRAGRYARWLLLSLPLTLALVHSNAFFAPFSAPKNAVLLLATALLAALALISSSSLQPVHANRPLNIAASVFVALNLASAITSSRPALSLNAFAFTICGVLLFAAARPSHGGKDSATNFRHLQIAIAASASVVSLITIAQFFRLTTFGIDTTSQSRMRMSSTLGNPDFVATFLAIALPFAIALALSAARHRALHLSAALLIAVTTLLTGSRAGLITMAAGVAIMAFTAMRSQLTIRLAVLVATALACSLALGTTLNPRTPSEALRGRLFLWQVTLSGDAVLRPLGGGPGTFAYSYPPSLGRFFSDAAHQPLLRFAGNEQHAQNDFIEALHDTGWLGMASLLALFAAWFAAALRTLRHSHEHPANAAAIASVAAFCAAALFDFPMHRADTFALLCISMAVPFVRSERPSIPRPPISWPRYAAAALTLMLGSYFALSPLAASYQLAQGVSQESNQHFQPALASYQSALRLQPSSPDANFNLVRALAETGDFERALAQSAAAESYVNEPELFLLRARILQNQGRDDEALRELNRGLLNFPYSKQLRDEIAACELYHPAIPAQ